MPIIEHRDEQQAPQPPIHGLRWPGRRDEPSGAEQSPVGNMTADELDEYLDVTGGRTPRQCASCENAAVPGKTRCQRCINENEPQNYEQLRERHPDLPVRRPNEARRFA